MTDDDRDISGAAENLNSASNAKRIRERPALVAMIGGCASALSAALIAGILWVKDTVIEPSDLRASIEHPTQFSPLISTDSPHLNGQTIYCDTIRFELLLSHNHHGSLPLLVNRVVLETDAVMNADGVEPACQIDPLSSHPYGIEQRDTFMVTLDKLGKARARFIHSEKAGQAWPIQGDNLLDSKERHISLDLNSNSSPILFDFYVYSHSSKLLKIWFVVDYDAGGPRTSTTNSILLSSSLRSSAK